MRGARPIARQSILRQIWRVSPDCTPEGSETPFHNTSIFSAALPVCSPPAHSLNSRDRCCLAAHTKVRRTEISLDTPPPQSAKARSHARLMFIYAADPASFERRTLCASGEYRSLPVGQRNTNSQFRASRHCVMFVEVNKRFAVPKCESESKYACGLSARQEKSVKQIPMHSRPFSITKVRTHNLRDSYNDKSTSISSRNRWSNLLR